MASPEQARAELDAKLRSLHGQGVVGVSLPPSLAQDDEPPRVCFGQVQSVANPVQTRNEMKIACGRTPRRQDAMTTDQDLVTCPLCKDVLAGLKAVGAGPTQGPPVTLLSPLGQIPGGLYRNLVESLNREQLEAKKADLEGELAAVGVLLDAARARERKSNEGAGG